MVRLSWSSIAVFLVFTAAGTGHAAEPGSPRIVAATASEPASPDESKGVQRLFDLDDTTAYCAAKRAKVKLEVTLAGPTLVKSVAFALGDASAWTERPRVKQEYVSVFNGERLVKKIRQKWPARATPGEGKVNLNVTGTRVVIDIDQTHPGSDPALGLCIGGLSLEAEHAGAVVEIDAADLASRNVVDDTVLTKVLTRKWTVVRATADGEAQAVLELGRRGKLSYRDPGLALEIEGKWHIEPAADGAGGRQLVFELTKARVDRKKVDLPAALARQVVPWHFARLAEGAPPAFFPWVVFAGDESGALTAFEPKRVTPAP